MLPAMLISMADYGALDTSQWVHCWVTIREQHEDALNTLLDAITEGGQYFYIAIGEIVLSGLSEGQISLLIEGHEDLFYRDDFDSVYLLEDLWEEAEDAVAQIARDATRQRLIAVNLSFSDALMIDKLRAELSAHPSLNHTEIEFGED
jgi:hypothetical protein